MGCFFFIVYDKKIRALSGTVHMYLEKESIITNIHLNPSFTSE